MTVWKISSTDANSILSQEAVEILQKLEDHKNRLEYEEYNKLLKKLAKAYPEYKAQIYSLKIRSDDDGNRKKPKSLKEAMQLSHAEKKQKIRQEFPR